MTRPVIPLSIRIAYYTKRQGTCLIYTGIIDRNGYGQIGIADKTYRIHRIVYEMLKGKIPDGLVLDHLCRVRNCINVNHLEPVTIQENNRRGFSVCAINKRKTLCKFGHKLNEDNTFISIRKKTQRSRRACQPCHNLTHRRNRMVQNGKTGFITDGIRTIYVPEKNETKNLNLFMFLH